MVILFIILASLFTLTVLLFTVALKIYFHFDTTNSEMKLTLLWLYPLIKSVVTSQGSRLVLTVYIMNKRILSRRIKPNKTTNRNRNFVKGLHPTDVNVNAQYGFTDPYFTGLAFSTISMISQFFTVESLCQKPDFLAFNDYICIDATARLNLGRSLLKLR